MAEKWLKNGKFRFWQGSPSCSMGLKSHYEEEVISFRKQKKNLPAATRSKFFGPSKMVNFDEKLRNSIFSVFLSSFLLKHSRNSKEEFICSKNRKTCKLSPGPVWKFSNIPVKIDFLTFFSIQNGNKCIVLIQNDNLTHLFIEDD